MAERKKINWLLILQGWAMLWVVIGHSGPSATFDDYPAYAKQLWNFAYSFHMSLFIMVSGFLFYMTRIDSEKWGYWAMLKEKLIRFGIPFVVFTFVALLMKFFFAGSVDRATTLSIGELANAILYPYNGPMREFWFLATIMWFFAFFPLWKLVIKNHWVKVIVLVSLGVLSIWHPRIDFLAINHVCQYAFFFYFGIICAILYKNNPEFILQRGFASVSFVVGVSMYIVGRLWSVPLMTPVGGAVFSIAIALWFEKMNPKTFISFRNYTYQIYLLGIFFNVICTILRAKFGLPFVPMQVLSLLMGLYMPVLISKLIEKINWKPLLLCVGLKGKTN